MRKIYLVLLMLAFLYSCKTTESEKRHEGTSMFVMIYDYDNMGVSTVNIYEEETLLGTSDIQGRFIIERDDSDPFTLRFEKSGYENIEVVVDYEPLSVLYVKIGNVNQFLRLAEYDLDEYMVRSALEHVNKSLLIHPERIDAQYLRAIILNKLGQYNEAEEQLKKIISTAGNIDYVTALMEKNTHEMEAFIDGEK